MARQTPPRRAAVTPGAKASSEVAPLPAPDLDPGSRPVEAVSGLPALAAALLTLESTDEVERFLRDLCTLPELEALTHRWQTVLLLDQGVPYVEIAGRVPTSTATVTRVAQWLRHGTGGYALALERAREGRGG